MFVVSNKNVNAHIASPRALKKKNSMSDPGGIFHVENKVRKEKVNQTK